MQSKLIHDPPSFYDATFWVTTFLHTLSGVFYILDARSPGSTFLRPLYHATRLGMLIVVSFALILLIVAPNWGQHRISSLSLVVLGFLGYQLTLSLLMGRLSPVSLIDITLFPLCLVLGLLLGRAQFQPDPFPVYLSVATLLLVCIPNILANADSLASFGVHLDYGGTIGSIYYILYLFPLLLYQKANFTRNILLISMVLEIAFSQKRGGILALSAALVCYYYSKRLIEKKKVFSHFLIFSLSIACILLLIYQINPALLGRFGSMLSDEGSGRFTMWKAFLERISQGSLSDLIFGRGHHAVTDLSLLNRPIMAHNDILETIYDYGLLGILLFGWICFVFLRRSHTLLKQRNPLAPIYTFSIVLVFVMILLSSVLFESGRSNSMAFFLGYLYFYSSGDLI